MSSRTTAIVRPGAILGRQVSGSPRARARRDGGRRRGQTSAARARGRVEVHAARRDRLVGRQGPFRPGGAGGRADSRRARGPRDGRRHARGRRALHGDGATSREGPRAAPARARPAARRRRGRTTSSRRARRSPRLTPSGIIHRDLKPANLFLTERPDGSPSVKVLDFGISKYDQGGALEPSLTRSQDVIGSPRYMSPEQMRSAKAVGSPTDVWALGCILHELVTAEFAFQGETPQTLGASILSGPTPSARALAPRVTGRAR